MIEVNLRDGRTLVFTTTSPDDIVTVLRSLKVRTRDILSTVHHIQIPDEALRRAWPNRPAQTQD